MIPVTKEVMYAQSIDASQAYFLAADIGGTNSNFGIFLTNQAQRELILSVHYKSQEITDFTTFMKDVIAYLKRQYLITIQEACIGAAGIVFPHRMSAFPTNLEFEINTNEIIKATGIKEILLINDFEAVALGVDAIDPKSIITVNPGVSHLHATIGFLGAGTGLGKSSLVWHRDEKRYLPVPSEGGHADAALYGADECALEKFIRERYEMCPVSWETVLSGSGIKKIYQFLGTLKQYPRTAISEEIEGAHFNPDRISFYASQDQRCKDTFDLYVTFYARCAKNFVLDVLALNGLYIAGGIATKNISLFFDPLFKDEFVKCGKQSRRLSEIPLYIISDYNVSLYGAVVASQLRKLGLL